MEGRRGGKEGGSGNGGGKDEPAEGSKKATKGKLYPGGAGFEWCFNESHRSEIEQPFRSRLLLSQKEYNKRFPLIKFRAMEMEMES